MKIKDVRTKTTAELMAMLISLKKEAFNLRFQKVSAPLADPTRVRQVRKAIARVKTILNEAASKFGGSDA